MQPHDKLFTPGPVEVSPKTWAAFSRPMISHRGDDFKNLYRAIHPGLQKLFITNQPVFLSTSSAWGVMEASIRNLVGRGVLNCMCGAFSDKWFDVAKRCGKNAEPLQVDWGKHIDHKAVDRHLATGKFDTVTLVHNETSTGAMNPLGEICGVLAKYPDVVLILDTVSSFSGVKIDMDTLGIDVMLAGAQKTLTCVKNNREKFNVPAFAKRLREKHHLVIDPGYGKIQGKTFRLSNMGDETEETVAHLLHCLDDCL